MFSRVRLAPTAYALMAPRLSPPSSGCSRPSRPTVLVIAEPATTGRIPTLSCRDSYLELTWTDEITGIKGYVVIDTVSRGVAGGGLRMRHGVTLQEVRDLAQAMTLKEAVVYTEGDRYVRLGGAKAASTATHTTLAPERSWPFWPCHEAADPVAFRDR